MSAYLNITMYAKSYKCLNMRDIPFEEAEAWKDKDAEIRGYAVEYSDLTELL
jgi:hypothetical protein